MCVSVCGGRSVRLFPKADTKPTWNGIRWLYSSVGEVLTRRFLLYNHYGLRFSLSMHLNVKPAFCNDPTACVRLLHSSLSSPRSEWASGFSILPAVAALSSSIPPFLTATPGTSSAGNLYWQWLLVLSAYSWGLSPPTGQNGKVQDAEVSNLCCDPICGVLCSMIIR